MDSALRQTINNIAGLQSSLEVDRVAQLVEHRRAYHEWAPVKVVHVIAVELDEFPKLFVSKVFEKCSLPGVAGLQAITELYGRRDLEITSAANYRMPRVRREELTRKLNAMLEKPEPELHQVSQSLELLVDTMTSSSQQLFARECLSCIAASTYRSSIVMAWNLVIDHLEDWVLTDGSRLNAFNSKWTDEWLSRRANLKNPPINSKDEFRDLKESKTLSVCHKATLVDKSEFEMLSEALRRRNDAAHPSLARTFDAPVASGHLSELIRFVLDHPL